MARIPRSFIDELVARTDIVELIGARVQLKKSGREFKACCPFHNEKSASFYVIPEKQFYHCFGCGAHGTALSFLMEHDRLPFPEAVEDLANRVGLEVPHEGTESTVRRPEASLFDLTARAARFYSHALQGDARARRYLEQRGITQESIERFAIGYAPDSWNSILKGLGTSDAARRLAIEAGLVIEGERQYDRFRDRVMFPIRDARGRTIGFGGRIIDRGEPKYLNSPETPLFHKGRELYGLYEVRQSRAKLDRLLIVEGFLDVVRLHQFGFSNVVATLGTATTAEHLRRVFRMVSRVVFSFDGDRAGRSAAWRALQNALPEAREGREIAFLFLPDGHDPDTLVAAEGAERFQRRIDSALPLSEYLVRECASGLDLSHADGRARFAEILRPLVGRIPAGLYRELLTARLAQEIHLSPDRLQELWGLGSAASDESTYPRGTAPRAARNQARHASGGRGGLVRQAVRVLLHFPQIAVKVPEADMAALAAIDTPADRFLFELLEDLRLDPAQNAAQMIERWRDRQEGAWVARLAMGEPLVSTPAGALEELTKAINRLVAEARKRFIDRLLAKEQSEGLDEAEKRELQGLIAQLTPLKAVGASS
jgi:DNA primase